MVRVVTLSRNARSWLTNTNALPFVLRNSSNHCIDSISRWLVGSSSSNKSGCCSRIFANSIRIRQPPENSEQGRSKSFRSKPKPMMVRSISAMNRASSPLASGVPEKSLDFWGALSPFALLPNTDITSSRSVLPSTCIITCGR